MLFGWHAERKGAVPSIPFPVNSGDSRGPTDYEEEVSICVTNTLTVIHLLAHSPIHYHRTTRRRRMMWIRTKSWRTSTTRKQRLLSCRNPARGRIRSRCWRTRALFVVWWNTRRCSSTHTRRHCRYKTNWSPKKKNCSSNHIEQFLLACKTYPLFPAETTHLLASGSQSKCLRRSFLFYV